MLMVFTGRGPTGRTLAGILLRVRSLYQSGTYLELGGKIGPNISVFGRLRRDLEGGSGAGPKSVFAMGYFPEIAGAGFCGSPAPRPFGDTVPGIGMDFRGAVAGPGPLLSFCGAAFKGGRSL